MSDTKPRHTLNLEVLNKIRDCSEFGEHSATDFKELREQVIINLNETIFTLSQNILKIITNRDKLSVQDVKYFEKFYQEFFSYIVKNKMNEDIKAFMEYFINFFAYGIETGNHALRMLFSKFLLLLLKHKHIREDIDEFSVNTYESLLECCFFLYSEKKIALKHIALKMLDILQFKKLTGERAKKILLYALSVEDVKEVRKAAFAKIKLDDQTCDLLAHRMKEQHPDVPALILMKFIEYNYDFFSLKNSSKFHLMFNVIFRKNDQLGKSLENIVLGERLYNLKNIGGFDDEPTNTHAFEFIYDRLINLISCVDIKLIFCFEQVYITLKQTLFAVFETFEFHCFSYIITAVGKILFNKQADYKSNEFSSNLFLLLKIIFFLNEMFEEEKDFDDLDPRKTKYSIYNSIRVIVDEVSVSAFAVYEIVEKIFALKDHTEIKHMILQYCTIIDFGGIERDKLTRFLFNYIANFDVSGFNYISGLEHINEFIESEKGFQPFGNERFIKPLDASNIEMEYFIKKNCLEFTPFFFKIDVIYPMLKILYFFGQDDVLDFVQQIKVLFNDIQNSQREKVEKVLLETVILMYFMIVFTKVNDTVSMLIAKHIAGVFNYIVRHEEDEQIEFIELCVLKAFGMLLQNDMKRMALNGSILKKRISNYSAKGKIIAFGILFDFFMDTNPQVFQDYIKQIEDEEREEIFSFDEIVETIVQQLFLTNCPQIRNILVTGLSKIIYHSKNFFKVISMDTKQIIANMILFWHDDRLRSGEGYDGNSIRALSNFFINITVISPLLKFKVINSLILIIETILLLLEKNMRLNTDIIVIDIEEIDKVKGILTSFIGLTNYEIKNIENGVPSTFHDFTTQEILILYLLYRSLENEDILDLTENNIIFFALWNHSHRKNYPIILSFLIDLFNIDSPIRRTTLKKIQTKIQEELDLESVEGFKLNEEDQERKEILVSKWDTIKNDAVIYTRNLDEIYKAIKSCDGDDDGNVQSKKKRKSKKNLMGSSKKSIKKIKPNK